jgi:hypothetical protein
MVFEAHNRYEELLESKTDLFLRVREMFNAGSGLGLGSCPTEHEYPIDVTLLDYPGKGYWEKVKPGPTERHAATKPYYAVNMTVLNPAPGDHEQRILSFFHKRPLEFHDYPRIRDKYPEGLTDEILTGAFARGCAEYLDATAEHRVEDSGLQRDLRIDKIAADHGFASELKAFLEHRLLILSGEENYSDQGVRIVPSEFYLAEKEKIKARVNLLSSYIKSEEIRGGAISEMEGRVTGEGRDKQSLK